MGEKERNRSQNCPGGFLTRHQFLRKTLFFVRISRFTRSEFGGDFRFKQTEKENNKRKIETFMRQNEVNVRALIFLLINNTAIVNITNQILVLVVLCINNSCCLAF